MALSTRITIIAAATILFLSKAHACQRQILRANGVTEQEKQIILDMHNKMRQDVALGRIGGQPPASNMMEMQWDDELAQRAQWWAQSCHSEIHDRGRHIADRFPVGQNIASTWTTRPPSSYADIESDFPDAIRKWFDEYKYFHFGGYGGRKTSHYTQMLWAESNLVGCGYAFYNDAVQGYTKYYVCNYGPSGNILGKMPYKSGYPSCNQYGLSDSSRYSGLCSKSSYYFQPPSFESVSNSPYVSEVTSGGNYDISSNEVSNYAISNYHHGVSSFQGQSAFKIASQAAADVTAHAASGVRRLSQLLPLRLFH